MTELQGKVTFVTGGASGIGRGMASVFSRPACGSSSPIAGQIDCVGAEEFYIF